MKAIILQSSKSAMQSGQSDNQWTLKFEGDKSRQYIEDYMAWTGSSDSSLQVSIDFETLEEAVNFASKNNIDYEIVESHKRKMRPKSYAKNFS
jgi:hypothetical protein